MYTIYINGVTTYCRQMDVDHQQQLRLQRQRGPHIGPGEPEVDPGAAPSRIQPHNRIQSCACSVDVGPPPGAMPSNASLYDPQSQNVQVGQLHIIARLFYYIIPKPWAFIILYYTTSYYTVYTL